MFLDSVIKTTSVNKVQLLTFSNRVQEEQFTVVNGDWSALREALKNSTYDGATIFKELNKVTKSGQTIVFTDGNTVGEDDLLSLDEGNILVNGVIDANKKNLRLWEFLNKVLFIDLTDTDAEIQNLTDQKIEGIVYLDGKPVTRVLVTASNGESMVTDDDGRFQYQGKIGDTLRINGGASNKREVVVENYDEEISFFLDSGTVNLSEVVVTEERKELED